MIKIFRLVKLLADLSIKVLANRLNKD